MFTNKFTNKLTHKRTSLMLAAAASAAVAAVAGCAHYVAYQPEYPAAPVAYQAPNPTYQGPDTYSQQPVYLQGPVQGPQAYTSDAAATPTTIDYAPTPSYSLPAGVQPLTADQIDSLTSSIALYPDPLLAVILPAAANGAEIAAANQYLQAHPNPDELSIDSLPFQPATKALMHYPNVIQFMAANPDWTQSLGSAFAYQPTDVMNSIQHWRATAAAAGSLQSTPQVSVVSDNSQIEIEPAADVIYVPVYDPAVVYVRDHPYYQGSLISYIPCGYSGIWLDNRFDWRDRVVREPTRPYWNRDNRGPVVARDVQRPRDQRAMAAPPPPSATVARQAPREAPRPVTLGNRPPENLRSNLQAQQAAPRTVQPQTIRPQTLQPQSVQSPTVQPQTIRPQTLQPQSVQSPTIQPQRMVPSVRAPAPQRGQPEVVIPPKGVYQSARQGSPAPAPAPAPVVRAPNPTPPVPRGPMPTVRAPAPQQPSIHIVPTPAPAPAPAVRGPAPAPAPAARGPAPAPAPAARGPEANPGRGPDNNPGRGGGDGGGRGRGTASER